MADVYSAVRDDFTFLARNRRGYGFSAFINILLAVETDMLLFRNTSPSVVVRLFEQIPSIPDAGSGVRSVFRIYKNPTVTADGTAVSIGALRNNQAASICQAFSLPTISARGILVNVYGIINTPVIRNLSLARFVEPGESILFTATPSAVATNHGLTQAWSETPP